MMRCYTYKILELSELINKFSEVAGYKINIQKSVMHKRKFRMYQRPKCKARHFKKKKQNNAICSNMDGPRDYHTK